MSSTGRAAIQREPSEMTGSSSGDIAVGFSPSSPENENNKLARDNVSDITDRVRQWPLSRVPLCTREGVSRRKTDFPR